MWQAVGHLLPIAVAVAVSSVPIMVVIMILLSPKRKLSALAFCADGSSGLCSWSFCVHSELERCLSRLGVRRTRLLAY